MTVDIPNPKLDPAPVNVSATRTLLKRPRPDRQLSEGKRARDTVQRARRRLLPRRWIPGFVLAAALLLTTAATTGLWLNANARDRGRFENAVQSARDRLVARLDIYIALLRATASLFAAEEVSLADFKQFVERLDVRELYPGVQGIGFTLRIPADSVDEVVADMRAAGQSDFHVWPDYAREEFHSIIYLEPPDARNLVAIGYDMFTNPVRRDAMERARDHGEPALSGPVELVQEIDQQKQLGFLIYVPVYEGVLLPPDVYARRRALQGFVYAPFRAGDLFDNIFGTEEAPRVDFRVFDGPTTDSTALLYDSRHGAPVRGFPAFTQTVELGIAGHDWTLVFTPSAAFDRVSHFNFVPLVAVAGVLTSLLMWVLSRGQQRARLAAEEANRAKMRFLARMSHELRTPLNAIAGYVDLLDLEIRGPVTPEQRRDLQRIKYAQEHLLGLINDVLNFAKVEAGRVRLDLQPVTIAEAVSTVAGLMRPLADARGIQFRAQPGDPTERAHADPEKLEQILLNLLSNAIKFTEPGGSAEISWEAANGAVAIHVTDTGRGIPENKLESIFEPFVQLDADLKTSTEGTGLGLAISHELARAMGGDITATSRVGAGSRFTLILPADPPATEAVDGRAT